MPNLFLWKMMKGREAGVIKAIGKKKTQKFQCPVSIF